MFYDVKIVSILIYLPLSLTDEDMAVYLQQRCDFYEKTLTFDSSATSCLQQCVWVTKALVMRGHREASKFVNIVSMYIIEVIQ